MKRLKTYLFALVVVLVGLQTANAHTGLTEIIVFGDSLSDTGNVFLASGGAAVGSPPEGLCF